MTPAQQINVMKQTLARAEAAAAAAVLAAPAFAGKATGKALPAHLRTSNNDDAVRSAAKAAAAKAAAAAGAKGKSGSGLTANGMALHANAGATPVASERGSEKAASVTSSTARSHTSVGGTGPRHECRDRGMNATTVALPSTGEWSARRPKVPEGLHLQVRREEERAGERAKPPSTRSGRRRCLARPTPALATGRAHGASSTMDS